MSGANLSNAGLSYSTLTNANLTGANLSNANLYYGTLTNANLTGANLSNANLNNANLSYGTLINANLSNATLAYVNLTNANLINADLAFGILTDANLTGVDLRGAQRFSGSAAITTNTILPDGTIHGLTLIWTNSLIVRNYSGTASIPIHIQQGMTLTQPASLVLEFDGNPWGSTISFDSGIPVTLGGNLELDVASGVDPSSLIGDTFQVFDWTGVNPSGQFASITNDLPSGYSWDPSQLYTTGDVTLVPEPSTFVLLGAGVIGLVAYRLRQTRRKRPVGSAQSGRHNSRLGGFSYLWRNRVEAVHLWRCNVSAWGDCHRFQRPNADDLTLVQR